MQISSTHRQADCDTGHYRRFKGYDYSRGAALFITFAVSKRKKVFGAIDGEGRLVHSPAGAAALSTLAIEERRRGDIVVEKSVIMPDHVHMRLYLRPGIDRPLARLAQFVANFKRWTKYNCAKLGAEIDWERGYHDRLCLSREIIELADKYIANNPLKWHLMHGNPPPLAVVEPVSSPRIPDGEWWSGTGALELANTERKICAVRLSRRIPTEDHAAVLARLARAADMGYVFAGTFISPCERTAAAMLAERGAPIIKAVPDPLAMVYRPKGDEPRQFADGRLLLLSRVAAPGVSRYDAWHGINDAIASFAMAAKGGLSLYVTSTKDFNFKFASS